MRRKHNLRLARAIQCISGVLAVLTIYPLVRVIYPCWRRLKGTGDQGESGGTGDHGESSSTGDPHATGPHATGSRSSGPSEPHGGPSRPTGESTAQSK
ncbi:MAG: hypothetical protein F4207_05975 [Gemmatimonadetes bacterium]|nr:hypothetical protein [Gemmatimonadota bacterium]MYA76577.1 hypothetical protein [Gemmatimonadota bacterium]MYG15964.1 hypothetical protein [Gemmatimonadota bacterium]MYH17936.1 hypothetical protein [Gemmatimonadota bacterium]MYK97889.1 hypothetical protein [Gemmatimonadota bacterium]